MTKEKSIERVIFVLSNEEYWRLARIKDMTMVIVMMI